MGSHVRGVAQFRDLIALLRVNQLQYILLAAIIPGNQINTVVLIQHHIGILHHRQRFHLCEGAQVYHKHVLIIHILPVGSDRVGIGHIQLPVLDGHALQIGAQAGQLAFHLQGIGIDLGHHAAIEGSVNVAVLGCQVTDAGGQVGIVHKRDTRLLHAGGVQLGQIVGTIHGDIDSIVVLQHILARIAQRSAAVLQLINVRNEIGIAVGCIEGKGGVVITHRALVQDINPLAGQSHRRTAIVPRLIIVIITTRCKRCTQSQHAQHAIK